MTESTLTDPNLARVILKRIQSPDDGAVYTVGAPGTPLADANAIDAALLTTWTAIRILESNSGKTAWFENVSDKFK